MKIVFAATPGGHLTELRMIFTKSVIGNSEIVWLTEPTKRTKELEGKVYVMKALENNPLPYFPALIKTLIILKKEKPNLIITSGAEIAVPTLIAAKLLCIKTLFIDDAMRTETPTKAGKIAYYLSNIFLVQYPEMKQKYGPRAKYIGGII